MSGTVLFAPDPHRCDKPSDVDAGTVWRCETCKAIWVCESPFEDVAPGGIRVAGARRPAVWHRENVAEYIQRKFLNAVRAVRDVASDG
jgi:hypothetical protein